MPPPLAYLLLATLVAANPHSHLKLMWRDEFNGPAGTPPDPTHWTYDLGNNRGWGNRELQSYTDSTMNVFEDGLGHLVIRALRQPDGSYTSGRIKTAAKYSFLYGRVEARIRIPFSPGIWPAFWMLGNGFPAVPWPECGEIDIVESFSPPRSNPWSNQSTLHGPGYVGTGITRIYKIPGSKSMSDAFHIYAVNWTPGSIQFEADGRIFETIAKDDLKPGQKWVFDASPFFLLFNVAVGGNPAGQPGPDTHFPADMLIDYVRVYQ